MPTATFNPYDCYLVLANNYHPGFVQSLLKDLELVSGHHFERVLFLDKPEVTPELEAIKQQTERKIIIGANKESGYFAIRYLCDDTHLPPAERRVQWIHTVGVGFNELRFEEIPDVIRDIIVTNGKSIQSRALAEYCMYSMLYFSRKTWQHQQNLAEHKWEPYNITELYGRKVVIFGYGDIGREAAKRALAFEMEVTGVKRSRPDTDVDDLGVRVLCGEDNNDDVLRDADFVINCMPGTNFNVDFFNKERFALMKPTAVYVNVGRGDTNNEDDLAEALLQNVIRGAAVDAFKTEPLPPTSALWSVPDDKLVLTCHNGAQFSSRQITLAKVYIRIMDTIARGEDVGIFSINKEMLY